MMKERRLNAKRSPIMGHLKLFFAIAVCLAGSADNVVLADEAVAYRPQIRKLMRMRCVSCHNPSRSEAGLDVTTYASLIAGSSSGTVLAEGDTADSLLFSVVTHDEEPAMPPNKKLDAKEIKLLRDWILSGLPEVPEDAKPIAQGAAQDEAVETRSEESATGSRPVMSPNSANRTAGLVFQAARANPVTALAVSPKNDVVAIAGQLQVVLYDVRSGALVKTLPFPEGEVFSLRFAADDSILLAGGGQHAESGSVVLWDVESGDRLRSLGDEYDIVLAADVSPDLALVALGGPAKSLTVYDAKSGESRYTLRKHTDWLLDIRFSPDGLLFLSSDRAGNVFVWESESGELLHTLRGQVGAIPASGWSRDGNVAMIAGQDGNIRLYDMHAGTLLQQWQAHSDGVLSLAVAPDSSLVSSGRDGKVKHWELDGSLRSEFLLKEGLPLHTRLTSNGVVVGDSLGQARIWAGAEKEPTMSLLPPDDYVTTDIEKIVASPVALTIRESSNPFDLLVSNETPMPRPEEVEPAATSESSVNLSDLTSQVVHLRVLEKQLESVLQSFETRLEGQSSSYDESRVLAAVALEKLRQELDVVEKRLGAQRGSSNETRVSASR